MSGPPNPCTVVAGPACRAPANGPRSTRARCYACGEPVCVDPDCSTVRWWHGQPKRRVCANCIDAAYPPPGAR